MREIVRDIYPDTEERDIANTETGAIDGTGIIEGWNIKDTGV